MPKIKAEDRYSERYLAPYAMKGKYSKGRKHKESEHPYRSMYQRDRERIIHTTAFRRLEYKTQVFVNHEGDHYRTRLTHTLEVTQIARTIARALLLNEDLTESIALAHDLGHTPFGHSGEDTLKSIMKDHGGFDHNLQGLRVVDLLEERYPDFKGLNLTYEVREGIVKHNTSYDNPPAVKEFATGEAPTLETQVVDIADEIAYYSHDLDDGLSSGILSEDELSNVDIYRSVLHKIMKEHPVLNFHLKRYQAVKMIINILVTDLLEESRIRIARMKIDSIDDVRAMPTKIIDFSSAINTKRIALRDFLFTNFYKNYKVVRMADKARRFIEELFKVYISKQGILPPFYQKKIKPEGMHRVVCDYIAGMTDRYALDDYKKFFEPYERI